jgi:hypothetical protein
LTAPRGWVNPVQLDHAIKLSITLGTDIPGENLFEQIFLRSMMAASGPLIAHGRISTLPIGDDRIGIVSEYSVGQSISAMVLAIIPSSKSGEPEMFERELAHPTAPKQR